MSSNNPKNNLSNKISSPTSEAHDQYILGLVSGIPDEIIERFSSDYRNSGATACGDASHVLPGQMNQINLRRVCKRGNPVYQINSTEGKIEELTVYSFDGTEGPESECTVSACRDTGARVTLLRSDYGVTWFTSFSRASKALGPKGEIAV